MSDILDRLRGNGQPWTFAEIIAEIEQLRAIIDFIGMYDSGSGLEVYPCGTNDVDFIDGNEVVRPNAVWYFGFDGTGKTFREAVENEMRKCK